MDSKLDGYHVEGITRAYAAPRDLPEDGIGRLPRTLLGHGPAEELLNFGRSRRSGTSGDIRPEIGAREDALISQFLPHLAGADRGVLEGPSGNVDPHVIPHSATVERPLPQISTLPARQIQHAEGMLGPPPPPDAIARRGVQLRDLRRLDPAVEVAHVKELGRAARREGPRESRVEGVGGLRPRVGVEGIVSVHPLVLPPPAAAAAAAVVVAVFHFGVGALLAGPAPVVPLGSLPRGGRVDGGGISAEPPRASESSVSVSATAVVVAAGGLPEASVSAASAVAPSAAVVVHAGGLPQSTVASASASGIIVVLGAGGLPQSPVVPAAPPAVHRRRFVRGRPRLERRAGRLVRRTPRLVRRSPGGGLVLRSPGLLLGRRGRSLRPLVQGRPARGHDAVPPHDLLHLVVPSHVILGGVVGPDPVVLSAVAPRVVLHGDQDAESTDRIDAHEGGHARPPEGHHQLGEFLRILQLSRIGGDLAPMLPVGPPHGELAPGHQRREGMTVHIPDERIGQIEEGDDLERATQRLGAGGGVRVGVHVGDEGHSTMAGPRLELRGVHPEAGAEGSEGGGAFRRRG
mmetsp:Transcript_34953/g.104266  ORF Transcript_34953/g.104266 Transcript_34953/m.104266 type:complete len:574 (-) Transcript_34953:567-2288(-)